MPNSSETIAAILEAGTFVHYAPQSRRASIEASGLDPNRWDEGAYGGIPCIRGPFFCLSPSWRATILIGALSDKFVPQNLVRIVIPAAVVALCDVDINWTNTAACAEVRRLATRDTESLLRGRQVDLICYSPILPHLFERIDEVPNQSPFRS